MSETYEPGRLYVATVRGVPDVRVFRTLAHDELGWFCPVYQDTDIGNGWWPDDDEVADVRPLVVLDPDDREQMDALCKALVNAAYTEREFSLAHSGIHPDTVTTALRSLLVPPKPAEPAGLGAVVEDTEGVDWHRTREGRWIAVDGLRSRAGGWGHIDAVKVLSQGVNAGD